MKNLMSKQWETLKRSQTGAALLMVLLVTVFVIMMGSSVIFSSYNGYLVKLVDRQGLETFYTTEDYLEQVKAAVQDFSSDSLQNAYTKVMSEYAFLVYNEPDDDLVQEAAQAKFSQYFMEELDKLYVSAGSGSSAGSITTTATDNVKVFEFMNESNFISEMNTASNATGAGTINYAYEELNGVSAVGSVSNPVGGTVDVDALAVLMGFDATSGVTMRAEDGSDSGSDTAFFTLEAGISGDRLVIHNVTVTFTDENGYKTNITTDIVIEMPDFVHTGDTNFGATETTFEGLPFSNAASIGKYWVKCSAPNLADGLLVEGDMYGGTFFVYQEGSNDVDQIIFSHGGGRLITHTGPIQKSEVADSTDLSQMNVDTGTVKGSTLTGFEIYDGTTFHSRESSEIWTSGINIHEGSNMVLQGEYGKHQDYIDPNIEYGGVYVGGDLMVYGGNDTYTSSDSRSVSNIVITGDYFGFGYGNTAEANSAIIIANDGVNLSLNYDGDKTYASGSYSQLKSMKIAGTAYLTASKLKTSNSDYAMGQSFATLPDQIAYLIPAGALSGTNATSNPHVTTESGLTVTVDTSYPLWDGKTIGDYMTSTTPITILNPYANGTTLAYYFFNFGEVNTEFWRTQSSKYFEDYVKANGTTFTSYYDRFASFILYGSEDVKLSDATISTAGAYYAVTKEGIQISSAVSSTVITNLETAAAEEARRFARASVTLDPEIPVNTGYESCDNPYDYYVRDDLIAADSFFNIENNQFSSLIFREGSQKLAFYRKNGVSYGGPNSQITGFPSGDEYKYDDICFLISTTGVNVQDQSGATFHGLAMSGVGVAIVSPISSYHNGISSSMNATTEIYLYDTTNHNNNGSQRVVYDDTKTAVNSDGDTVIGLDAYKILYKDFLEDRDDSYLKVHTDGNITVVVPLYAYFDNLIYTSGGAGDGEFTAGAGELDVKVNWAPDDLVYFENWEKH